MDISIPDLLPSQPSAPLIAPDIASSKSAGDTTDTVVVWLEWGKNEHGMTMEYSKNDAGMMLE
jgi:hypothetical protein